MEVELYPGWPLHARDYRAVTSALSDSTEAESLVIGHSLGALHALQARQHSTDPIVLLAPSTPKSRRGRGSVSSALAALSVLPKANKRLGRLLRRLTYWRYRVDMPEGGAAMTVEEAAQALALPLPDAVSDLAECLVVVSPEDDRSDQQRAFALSVGAPCIEIRGGHLFPIVNAEETATVITNWLRRRNVAG